MRAPEWLQPAAAASPVQPEHSYTTPPPNPDAMPRRPPSDTPLAAQYSRTHANSTWPIRPVPFLGNEQPKEFYMLHYAIVFFVIALVAAIFGFGGIAAGAVGKIGRASCWGRG